MKTKRKTAEGTMSSVYQINKGINKPIEFKGLKAQYIWYLGGGLLALLVLFAVLYIAGLNSFVCVGIIVAGATALFMKVYALSRKYGQYGMMKAVARRSLPRIIKSHSRKVFLGLSRTGYSRRKNSEKVTSMGNRINKSLL
ncbi:MAG: DUF4133 domain-containing protein [Bacteroidota bacterium]